MNKFILRPIGIITSKEGLQTIQLNKTFLPALNSLEGFGHLNVIWWFDGCDNETNRGTLTEESPYKNSPPVMGAFATCSPSRPNPIALSTAEILSINMEEGVITLSYIDAQDNSPVLDLKPYTPSLDRVEHLMVPDWCSHWSKNVETSGNFPWEEQFNF
jgi:tRNA-Thr(GGU) m(6)t(6)A37 methyltransferase TsaA